jgi:predicted nuclease of predicted toxin-antitoxin system
MWLLDANMDVHLVSVLKDFGIASDTASNRGWKALSNGELVTAAVAAGFACLLTRDQLFGQSAARALKSFPQFAVVVVRIPQQPWNQYRDRFVSLWMERAIEPIPGQLIRWP